MFKLVELALTTERFCGGAFGAEKNSREIRLNLNIR